jgi:hypothetical protein
VEDDEYAPTDEPQDCSKCRRHLEARWFHLKPQRTKGRHSICLACVAEGKRSRHSKQQQHHQTPEQKECARCQQILAADCFHRQEANADGLMSYCKECDKDRRRKVKALTHVPVRSKCCCQCNLIKPSADFAKSLRSVDGLQYYCRECTR